MGIDGQPAFGTSVRRTRKSIEEGFRLFYSKAGEGGVGNGLGKGRRHGPHLEKSLQPSLVEEFSSVHKGTLRNKTTSFCHRPSIYQVRNLYRLLISKRLPV